ncbi:MAG: sialate O-acetylesterase [Lachnospiraceae bacterium]
MESYQWKLAELFQSNMMFQREKETILWGEATPGMEITAKLAKADSPSAPEPIHTAKCTAGLNGTFQITFPPQEAGYGYSIHITNSTDISSEIVLDNICFGDIWLAGGQSNMEFFLKYDRDWENTKKLRRNPNIRMFNMPQRAFEGHTTHNKAGYGYWFDDSCPGIECFSAPAYSFARNVQEATGIPIGIIGCNWGGSTAAAWVPEHVLQTPPLDRYLKEYEEAIAGIPADKLAADSLEAWKFEDSPQHGADFEPLLYGRNREWQLEYMKQHADDPVIPMGPYNMNRPAGLYHTMLSKLIPFPIKGVLWYQGESDAGDRAFMYDKLLTALIKDWRKEWMDDLPFLIVQLAPFGVWLDCGNQEYKTVREKQTYVADNVEGVYMASIMDLGSYYDIHPKEKMEVGRRLALLARGHVYGEKNLLCDAPKAVSAILDQDGRIVITFRHGDGLTIGSKPSAWDIAIDDLHFTPDSVYAENDCLILIPPAEVKGRAGTLRVSLGRADYAEIHIHNSAGLCAAPFTISIDQEVLSK